MFGCAVWVTSTPDLKQQIAAAVEAVMAVLLRCVV
jgi:hypothetical protein